MKNKILLLGDITGVDFYITKLLHCSHKSQMTTHQNSVTISAMQVEIFSHLLEQNCIICYQITPDFKHLPVVLYSLPFIKKDKEITGEIQTFEKAFILQLEDLLSRIII